MKSVIITIGDELLIGQVVNTNAAFIAEKLNSVGIEVVQMLTVADREQDIVGALRVANSFDIVVVTGGLGPTHDDITKKAVCKFLGVDLIASAEARTSIERFLEARNHRWSDSAEEQTLIPAGCTIIPNDRGTAPGELFEREGKYLIVMPGVPYEMEQMMTGFVVPFFQQRTRQAVVHRTLRTAGIPESTLAARLAGIEDLLGEASLAFLPSSTGVRLRISVVRDSREAAEDVIQRIESYIRERAAKYVYGVEDEELEDVLGSLLTDRKLTVAVAESCTGGLVVHRLTNVPGSSAYVERGVITYSNRSKTELLGVPAELMKSAGAVSSDVAKAMARGIRETARTDIGISTTGIAGPTGGTPEKPIGLVWIGYSDSESTVAISYRLGEQRIRIKERAAQAALELLRRKLLNIPVDEPRK